MLMSLSTVSTTRHCIAQETFCEFVRVINVTIIIIIMSTRKINIGTFLCAGRRWLLIAK